MRNKLALIYGIRQELAKVLLHPLRREGYTPVTIAHDGTSIEYDPSPLSEEDPEKPVRRSELRTPFQLNNWLRDLRDNGEHLDALVTGLRSERSASLEHGTPEMFAASLSWNIHASVGMIERVIPYLNERMGSIVIVGDTASTSGQGYVAAEGAISQPCPQ